MTRLVTGVGAAGAPSGIPNAAHRGASLLKNQQLQSSKGELFGTAGDRAGRTRSTATEMGTPKASEGNMTSAREGVFRGLWPGQGIRALPNAQQGDSEGL